MEYMDQFSQKVIGAFGSIGEKWLEELDSIVQNYIKKWNLTFVAPVDNLSYNYVVKVKDAEDNPFILKIGIPNYGFSNEIRTLETYGGKGCAAIIKSDAENGAMLLEHILPGTMLTKVEELNSISHFAKVWSALRRSVKKNANHPSIGNWMESLDRFQATNPTNQGLISDDFICLAKTYFMEITNSSKGSELLHGDLHHENILYSDTHGWIAIDPKGVTGDPYFDTTSFLINQLFNKPNPKKVLEQRVNLLCDEMQMDKNRLLKAAIAMSILYACWGIDDNNSDWKNTYLCAQWFEEFRSPNLLDS